MIKDEELDEMQHRADLLAEYLGEYASNEYVCFICVEQGRVGEDATYLDWPHAIEIQTGQTACYTHRHDPRVMKLEELQVTNVLAFTPNPVGCRNCGTMLYASHAQAQHFGCPSCLVPCCYTCGCTDLRGCEIREVNGDNTSSMEMRCSWSQAPGVCSFCRWRAAYEFYQLTIGQPANDPFYMSIGRTVHAEAKGLAHGV